MGRMAVDHPPHLHGIRILAINLSDAGYVKSSKKVSISCIPSQRTVPYLREYPHLHHS